MSEKRRFNAKRILSNLLWAFLGMATVILLGAAMSAKNNKQCKGVNINIKGNQHNFFIDKKEIGDILRNFCGSSITGKTVSSFNLAEIENLLKKNQWIKSAELFFDNNKVLRVDVIEREPVARIFTSTGSSFYLDTALAVLPLSDKSSARVPVFSNFPSLANKLTKADSSLLNDIKNISHYILNDPFWMAQIDQVDITANRTFEMIPKVGNQIIVFGNADNYEEKFRNLLIFYKQVATKVGWNKYSKINAQYKGQIVGVKRGLEDVIQDSLRTKQLMQLIVANALKQSYDSINIQLVQQPGDDIIPANILPDNFTDLRSDTTATQTTAPVKTIAVDSNAKTAIAKVNASQKEILQPIKKSFPLKPPIDKPSGGLKKPDIRDKLTVNKKSKTYSTKQAIVLKPPTKPINKSTIKRGNKIKTEPKAVMPPKNDY